MQFLTTMPLPVAIGVSMMALAAILKAHEHFTKPAPTDEEFNYD